MSNLIYASSTSSHTSVVRALLAKGADTKITNLDGKTALDLTKSWAGYQHEEIVRLLKTQ